LYYAWQHGGLTLHEFGDYVECGTFAVSKAVSRIKSRLQSDRSLQKTVTEIEDIMKSKAKVSGLK